MASVLSLSASSAKNFFLRSSSYFNGDLPGYFSFDNILSTVSKKLGKGTASDFYAQNQDPKTTANVNYKIITNKDGNLDWRQLSLIHPVLYVDLVNLICKQSNWDFIKTRFSQFQTNKNIKCASIPVYNKTTKKTQKECQVSTWVKKVEQESIVQSLMYEFIFTTDIANCYPSIYTHSISWALHGQDIAKEQKGKLFGDNVDKAIRGMSYGQSNGIPQGSVLMDFIAEIVLGYTDEMLSQLIKTKLGNVDYHIIRYRDDYRIFVKDSYTGECILQCLSEVLQRLGLKLNTNKTSCSRNIIEKSVKPEKIGKTLLSFKTNQDKLLYIYKQSLEHPNSGNLNKLLGDFLENEKILKSDHKPLLLSIITNIAYNNPRTYPQSAAIISNIIDSMGCGTKRKIDYINQIQIKFTNKPNSSYMDIWLQRITYPLLPSVQYNEPLCNIITEKDKSLWNNDWLNPSMAKLVCEASIIDKEILKHITPVIPAEEVNLFHNYE